MSGNAPLLRSRCAGLVACCVSAVALLSTGCGIGVVGTSSPMVTAATFQGSMHGGESPVVYGKISFYETAATGVATSGVYVPSTPLTALGSTYTDANGNFKFTSALACNNANDYVYVTGAGGNTGSYPGTLNPNNLLLAAVGPCAGFGANTFIIINEQSTIAAAYALSGFTSVTGGYTTASGTALTNASAAGAPGSGTVTFAVVNSLVSGQPITVTGCTPSAGTTVYNGSYFVQTATSSSVTVATTNSAGGTDSGCTLTPTIVSSVPTVSITASSTNYATSNTAGTSAAGLAHAFANALNLVNNQGQVNPTIGGNQYTVVPAAAIGTLANILQTCVNSTGGSAADATGGSATPCGKLFYYGSGVSGGTTTGAPNNTLSAALNIAHNPSVNVASIYALAPSTGAAFPVAYTTQPNDFSLAVAYNKYFGQTNGSTACVSSGSSVPSNTNGICYPYSLALDGNDDVYVLNSNGSSTVSSNVVAFTSYGTPIFSTALDTTTVLAPRYIAADGLGNLFYDDNTSASPKVVEISAANGVAIQTFTPPFIVFGVAVDGSNNVWYGSTAASSSSPNLVELVHGTGTNYTQASFGSLTTPNVPVSSNGSVYQIVPDKYGNIWANEYSTSKNPSPIAFPYTAPVAGTSNAYSNPEVTAQVNAAAAQNYGMVVDSSGNGWVDTTNNLYKLTLNSTTGATSMTASAAIPIGLTSSTPSARFLAIDGNNQIWGEDNASTSSSVFYYTSTATTPTSYILKPGVSNTQAAYTSSVVGPRLTQIDSTGAVWVVNSTNGQILQIIGTGAPTWPLLAATKPGLMP